MNKSTADQLLEMLDTIGETEAFLRKRCAAGQAGQSMGLFEDLASLLELMDSRYRKSGYLPREHAPVFGQNPDILSAVRFLDAVDDWTGRVKDRVKRRKVRQELARGGILEAAVKEGKPFAKEAEMIAQLVRAAPPADSGSPEERAGRDRGVTVSFSSRAMEQQKPPAPSERPEPAPAAPLDDPAAEGERLFSGIRARGRIGARLAAAQVEAERRPASLTQAADGPPVDARPLEPQTRPMGAKPMEPEARPMGTKPMEPEARPIGTKPMEPGARPMGTKPMEPGARPMGTKPMEPEARPMGAKPMEPEARPMGAKPMEPGARPMGAKPASPPPPALPEKTTSPAIGRGIAIDRAFLAIINELGALGEDDVANKLISAFPKLENRYKMVLCDQARRFGFWGRLEPDRNEYELLRRRGAELVNHRDEYSWLYGQLGDYRSRKTLLALLDNWYSFNFKDLSNMKEKLFSPYLDADLLRCADDEVFVDLGAGTGDVTAEFTEFAGHWKKIYCYEPQRDNFAALRNRVRTMGLVEARQKAVGARAGQGTLVTKGDPLLSRLGDGGAPVDVAALDEDVAEPVTMIKMCLEGGEQEAIRGCSNHIHRDHPRLALRADHGDSDLWQLPRMIERLDKKYRFYLRHYGGNLLPMEYVIYAV